MFRGRRKRGGGIGGLMEKCLKEEGLGPAETSLGPGGMAAARGPDLSQLSGEVQPGARWVGR